jgi:hypothetical protein
MEEEKEIILGVYFHPKKGFAIAEKDDSEDKFDWKIDKNKSQKHPFFRIDYPVVNKGTGSYFFYKDLKDYEYIGEL